MNPTQAARGNRPPQPTRARPPTIGACVFHVDYHRMTDRCWRAAHRWLATHTRHLTLTQAKAAYQAEVERLVLNQYRTDPAQEGSRAQ